MLGLHYIMIQCLCDKTYEVFPVRMRQLVLISKYNKTIDKVFRGKILIINDCPIRTDFLTALSFNIIFHSKRLETIPDLLESSWYDVKILND